MRASVDMDASGLGSIRGASDAHARERRQVGRQHLIAAGGILGALAASSCCIVPLILFSFGIGGAWIGNLTALAPYQPLFVAGTAGPLRFRLFLLFLEPRPTPPSGNPLPPPPPHPLFPPPPW